MDAQMFYTYELIPLHLTFKSQDQYYVDCNKKLKAITIPTFIESISNIIFSQLLAFSYKYSQMRDICLRIQNAAINKDNIKDNMLCSKMMNNDKYKYTTFNQRLIGFGSNMSNPI